MTQSVWKFRDIYCYIRCSTYVYILTSESEGITRRKVLVYKLFFSTEFQTYSHLSIKVHVCKHEYYFSSCCIETVSIGLMSINCMLLNSDIHSDPIFHLFLDKMVFIPLFNYGFPIWKDATSITGIILWNWITLQRSDAVGIFRVFL